MFQEVLLIMKCFLKQEKIQHIFTSSKTGYNIEETFDFIGRLLLENKKNNKDNTNTNTNVNLDQNTLINERRRCC